MQTLKGFATILALIAALFILTPTVFNFSAEREQLEKAGEPLKWYHNLFPEKELNLGLDLQGGVYIEMEVGVEDAMDHHINFLLSDIKSYVLRDELKDVKVERAGKKSLRVSMAKDQISTLEAALIRVFGPNQFDINTEATEIFYTVSGSANAQRKQAIQKLQTLYNDPTLTPEVKITGQQKFLSIAFKDDIEKEKITNLFSDWQPTTPPNTVYVQLSQNSLDRIKKDVIEQAAQSVRNRIDRFGLAETQVSRQGEDRLVIELPGEDDPKEIIDIVKRTGKLEFRIVDNSISPTQLQSLINAKSTELNITVPYEDESLKKLNAALKADLPAGSEILFNLVRNPQTKKVSSSLPYLVEKKADVTGDMLENASIQSDGGMPIVALRFNKSGTKKFGEVTTNNVNRQLAIVLDNVVTSAPNIRGPITNGSPVIELGVGNYQEIYKEAETLTMVLKEGALPASLKMASKNYIGPSLGQDSIDAGIKSILISGVAVLIFMMLYYRLGGIIADLALLLNVLLIFGSLSLFGAALTLPGIAGIVLTLGMAVDANVIIFERMREEKQNFHEVHKVIDVGYRSGISAIVDGNITTFIAAMFLFQFGTGPIKGFATTLMIGIASTLFTAIVVSRFLYDWSAKTFKLKKIGF